MILIDIGSMKGEEIVWGLKNGYEIHAFEPNPNMKSFLEPYRFAATINYAAAWDEDGKRNLYLMATPEPGEDGLTLIEEKSNNSKSRFIEVPTINIGRYLKELDRDIDILKINAEGAEYVILESILDNFDPKRIKKWLVEDHENYIAAEEWRKKKAKILERCEKEGILIEEYHGL